MECPHVPKRRAAVALCNSLAFGTPLLSRNNSIARVDSLILWFPYDQGHGTGDTMPPSPSRGLQSGVGTGDNKALLRSIPSPPSAELKSQRSDWHWTLSCYWGFSPTPRTRGTRPYLSCFSMLWTGRLEGYPLRIPLCESRSQRSS
ncbi:hypothetical protein FALCPG4_001458 [Fusarium falciforme]